MRTILILSLFISSLFSHPHTFIDVHPTIEVKNDSTVIVNFKWVLDDMASTILIMDLDQNGDGKIDEKENSYIYEEYFSVFREYDYYTYIKVDGKDTALPEPENFRATIENNKICYSFDIKLNYDIKSVVIEFGDSSYYVAMVLKEKFVDAKGLSVKVTKIDYDYFGYRLELK